MNAKTPFWHRPAVWLAAILAVGAALRVIDFGSCPPGLNQDEAANAWNAWCLLHTGKDMTGQPWPIYYSRMLGGNYTTLNFYLLIPFQAIGGMNVITTRLPALVSGILTIWLLYCVARRMFGTATGLVAAALLAVTPWHIYLSRWGVEANLSPLLALIPLALVLWARLPFADGSQGPPRIVPSLVAGLITGICCYGYGAVRLYVPVFLLAAGLATAPAWRRHVRTRQGAIAIGAFVLGLALTLGPLAYQHIADPSIGKHSRLLSVWSPTDSPVQVAGKIATRYVGHFWIDFLFVNGDPTPMQWMPHTGVFQWYMLPLWLIAMVALASCSMRNAAARVAIVAFLAYPAGDLLHAHAAFLDAPTMQAMHAFRSSPGLCGMVMVGAVGAVAAWRFLAARSRKIAIAAAAVLVALAVVLTCRFERYMLGSYVALPDVYHAYHADIYQACRWLKPRMGKADAVVCTTTATNQPYIVCLVAADYSPKDWFADPHIVWTDEPDRWSSFSHIQTVPKPGEWDQHEQFGKWFFPYTNLWQGGVRTLLAADPNATAWVMVRPGELHIAAAPVYSVRRPDGRETLQVFRLPLQTLRQE